MGHGARSFRGNTGSQGGSQVVSKRGEEMPGHGGSSVSRTESLCMGVGHGRTLNQHKNPEGPLVLVFRRQPGLVFDLILWIPFSNHLTLPKKPENKVYRSSSPLQAFTSAVSNPLTPGITRAPWSRPPQDYTSTACGQSAPSRWGISQRLRRQRRKPNRNEIPVLVSLNQIEIVIVFWEQ